MSWEREQRRYNYFFFFLKNSLIFILHPLIKRGTEKRKLTRKLVKGQAQPSEAKKKRSSTKKKF